MVVVLCLRDVRLIWAMGMENRDDPHVVAGLQVALDDLTSLTGGCRAPVLRLHSDKEFLATSVRKLLRAHSIRQTTQGMILPRTALLRDGLGSLKSERPPFWPNTAYHLTIGHMLANGLPMCTIIEC